MKLIVFSAVPGLAVAGVHHPRIASHLVTTFTEDQLRQMIADPNLAICVGIELTAADVEGFIATHCKPPAPEDELPAEAATKPGKARAG